MTYQITSFENQNNNIELRHLGNSVSQLINEPSKIKFKECEEKLKKNIK